MDKDKKGNWKKFRRLKFDAASFTKHAQQAETATTRHAHKFVVERMASIRDVSRQVTIWLAVIAVLIMAVALQFMWFERSYKTNAAIPGGTYAEAALGPIETLNPLYANSSAERSADRLIYSGLYDYDKTGNLRKDLASSMSVDETGKIYTVSLRGDARWHDDTLLTADDIVFTVDTMKNPAARATMQSSWADIEAKALDTRTVQFTLPSAYSAFPQALTFSVLPKHVLADVDPGSLRQSPFSVSPIGTGPFRLKLLQGSSGRSSESVAYLSQWEKYYRGAVKLSRFELHAYKSSNDIVKAIENNDVNAAVNINGMVKKLPSDYKVETYKADNGVYALMNTNSSILSDVSVRKALQVGTDVGAVKKTLGYQTPSLDYPFLASELNGIDLPKKPKYNVAQAKQLLEKSGWKLSGENDVRTKDDVKLMIKVVALNDPQYNAVVKNLATQWKQLGFDVQVQQFDPEKSSESYSQSVLQPRAYDVLINELVLGADPDVFAYWHSSQANPVGLNFSNYVSPVVDDALSSARLRRETNLRDLKYKAFASQWLSDAPAIGLYQSVVQYAHTKRTSALERGMILPTEADRYSNIENWTAEKAQVYKTP